MVIKRLASVLLVMVVFGGCNRRETGPGESPVLTAAQVAAVESGVRTFMAAVARDVTQEGPLAWSSYFDESPAFFMAVNGQMAFPSGAAAKDGMPSVAQAIKHIDLKWGDDLRIDALTPELAVLAAPWHEVQTNAGGHIVEESGFFTAVAEYRNGRWLFRNAHWSSPVAASH